MGNVLQKQVYPGALVADAEQSLRSQGFTVRDIYALNHQGAAHGIRNLDFAFFHGNREDVSRSAPSWQLLRGRNLIGFEYPGYGWRASEEASQQSFLQDTPLQRLHICNMHPKGIVVCGRSLGSFAAINLAIALGPKCRALVLISPLLSAVATKVPPPFHLAFGMVDYANNEALVSGIDVSTPVFIAHGARDQVVPISNAEALCNALPAKCRRVFIRLQHATHHNVLSSGYMWKDLDLFLDSIPTE
jgi:pimeloyl-ACP methyl ester carboxylesterase